MFSPADILDLSETEHAELFPAGQPVWSALSDIGGYLERLLERIDGPLVRGEVHESAFVGPRVHVAPGATIEPHAVVKGPAWIGPGTVVRSGAYLRENVIAGSDCVLGNSSEFKNCLLFNDCEAPHFNYVGDSILGHRAHLGAGVICSNVRLDRARVKIRTIEGSTDTGLRKFGAVVGDRTEIGCNAVLSPGSILGRDCIVYPGTHWAGVLGNTQIVKNRQEQNVVRRHLTEE
ncbi:MAG: UDP-N-acetylglucosamine diphosphorylase [Verrucomicrobiales bacterium]